MTRIINYIGCHYFPPGLQIPPQPLRRLLPTSMLAEQRHDGCEQFAQDCYPCCRFRATTTLPDDEKRIELARRQLMSEMYSCVFPSSDSSTGTATSKVTPRRARLTLGWVTLAVHSYKSEGAGFRGSYWEMPCAWCTQMAHGGQRAAMRPDATITLYETFQNREH